MNSHGLGGYNRGCRCEVCRQGRREYDNDRYQRLFSVRRAIAAKAVAAERARIRAAVEGMPVGSRSLGVDWRAAVLAIIEPEP